MTHKHTVKVWSERYGGAGAGGGGQLRREAARLLPSVARPDARGFGDAPAYAALLEAVQV